MRSALQDRMGQCRWYRATFARYGRVILSNRDERLSLLLTRVCDCDGGILVADHLWITQYSPFMHLGLERGERIQFRAEVGTYTRRGGEADYYLRNIASVQRAVRR